MEMKAADSACTNTVSTPAQPSEANQPVAPAGLDLGSAARLEVDEGLSGRAEDRDP
jgi:hypothetical protein